MNYDSYASDDDNFDYSSTDSSSEDDPSDNDMISIPDDYSPEDGAESDDDTKKYCHWSKTQNNCTKIDLTDEIAPHGSLGVLLPNDTTPANIAERVLDDNFIDMAINCTNSHGQGDQNMNNILKIFPVMRKVEPSCMDI